MKVVYKKNKGASLVIAMILVPVFLLISAAMIQPIVNSYRAAAADQKRILAKSIANNLFEQALLATSDLPTGTNASGCLGTSGAIEYNGTAPVECPDEIDYGYGKAIGRWTVFGKPQTDEEHLIGGRYYIPSVGTGDAGGDYCSSADPVYDSVTLAEAVSNLGISTVNLNLTDPADWPCNWSKLKEGESVSIPLYVELADGTILNPSNLQLEDFQFRMRSACNPTLITDRTDAYTNEICMSNQRYTVAGDVGNEIKTVIVLWEIIGEEMDSDGNPTGKKINLRPNTDIYEMIYDSNINTTKLNQLISAPNAHVVVNQNSLTDPLSENEDSLSISSHLSGIYKPVLNVILVHSLKDLSENKIPYLEYQFRSNNLSVSPIANSSKVIKVEVIVDEGYTETIEKTIALPKPSTGFVIQQ